MTIAANRAHRGTRALVIVFIALGATNAIAQNSRPGLNATRASLPNTTPEVTPSRGVGPFDARQAQDWHDTAETLCAQSRFAEAERFYLKLLEEREHSLG